MVACALLFVVVVIVVCVVVVVVVFGLNVFKAISKNTEIIRNINDMIHSFLLFFTIPTISVIKKTIGRQSNKIINKLPQEVADADVIILINIV